MHNEQYTNLSDRWEEAENVGDLDRTVFGRHLCCVAYREVKLENVYYIKKKAQKSTLLAESILFDTIFLWFFFDVLILFDAKWGTSYDA